MPDAVIFDLDGVLVDTEQLWDQVRQAFVREAGGTWREEATRAMMGMSSAEWPVYLHDDLGVPLAPAEINRAVVTRLQALYRERLPLLPGAVEAVNAVAARWPVAVASSSNRELIDLFLELTDLADVFGATVSSEEVARGKPHPDVYLEAARRLGIEPAQAVAVEDSTNGLRAAAAAGMVVVAVPNSHFGPAEDALALAAVTVGGVNEVTPALVERVAGAAR